MDEAWITAEELCGELMSKFSGREDRPKVLARLAVALLWRAMPELKDAERRDILEDIKSVFRPGRM